MQKTIKDLFIDELQDVCNAEKQIAEALPAMVTAAESTQLKNAFNSHLKETQGQIKRLDKIFTLLKIEKKGKFCKATKGLIEECKSVFKEYDKSPLRDAALISKAQRIEHYEISAYGTLRTFARELNLEEVADLLETTLNQESNADKKLSQIAEGAKSGSGINQKANPPAEIKSPMKSKSASSKANQKSSTSSPKKAAATSNGTKKRGSSSSQAPKKAKVTASKR